MIGDSFWQWLLLLVVPEVLLLFFIVPLLAGHPVQIRPLMSATILFTPILVLSRLYLPFGTHTLIGMTAAPVFIAWLFTVPYKQALQTYVISIFFLLVTEMGLFLTLHPRLFPGLRFLQLTTAQAVLLSLPKLLLLLSLATCLRMANRHALIQRIWHFRNPFTRGE